MVICGLWHVFEPAMSHGSTQYIARLVANEHSNGGSTSTVVAVRLSRGGDAGNASHVPKTRGRTDEEFRRRNLRKIPLALLGAACAAKLVLLTHSTKFVFSSIFFHSTFSSQFETFFLCPAFRPISPTAETTRNIRRTAAL